MDRAVANGTTSALFLKLANIELSSRADSKPQARFHGKTAELTSVHSADCSNDLLDPDYS
jgi:hypothetical protein